MPSDTILDLLRSAGLLVELTPDSKGLAISPARLITPDLREAIAYARESLIQALGSEAANDGKPVKWHRRVERFAWFGIDTKTAQDHAEKLMHRDTDMDDRRMCLECKNLNRASSWRCSQWRTAGVTREIAADLVTQLQRCDAFALAELKRINHPTDLSTTGERNGTL